MEGLRKVRPSLGVAARASMSTIVACLIVVSSDLQATFLSTAVLPEPVETGRESSLDRRISPSPEAIARLELRESKTGTAR